MADYVPDRNWRENVAADVRGTFSRLVGEIREDARALVPVDTGRLRESIDSEINGDTARIGSDLNYALYVEEGHRVGYAGPDGETVFTGNVVPPQPFLRPALYRKRGG